MLHTHHDDEVLRCFTKKPFAVMTLECFNKDIIGILIFSLLFITMSSDCLHIVTKCHVYFVSPCSQVVTVYAITVASNGKTLDILSIII